MKVGDLVKFTHAHSSQSGFEYCADWVGIVLSFFPQLTISWVYPPAHMFTATYKDNDLAHMSLETISESGRSGSD
jgi:hypothetical protein